MAPLRLTREVLMRGGMKQTRQEKVHLGKGTSRYQHGGVTETVAETKMMDLHTFAV